MTPPASDHEELDLPVVVIDGAAIDSLADFYDEVSKQLMSDVDWKVSNLDGFNDILRGGFGGPERGFILRWEHANRSREVLGWPETIRYLEQKLTRCHSSNAPAVAADLAAARRGEGSTLFEIVRVHGPGGRESEDNVILELE